MDRPLRILLAEDDPALRTVLEMTLQGWGHEVETAPDGPTALRALLEQDFDAALLDTRLPGMQGPEVARRARASRAAEELPLMIGLTADVFADTRAAYAEAGVETVLVKPVDWENLQQVLEKSRR